MAEVFGIVGSAAGVIQLTLAAANGIITLIQDIRDAPEEVLFTRRDVQSLGAILTSTYDTCVQHNLNTQDQALTAALAEYLDMCDQAIKAMHKLLEPLVSKGLGRRDPRRMIEWTMKKGEVRGLRERINHGKASLTLVISAINGVLQGKGQAEIKADVAKLYQSVELQFKEPRKLGSIRKRIEKDIELDSVAEDRTSVSGATDRNLVMDRFLTPAETPSQVPDPAALLEAVRTQNITLVQELISLGSGVSVRSPEGFTTLHFCAIYNDGALAELLIKNGADVNAKDYQLRSPIKLALSCDALEVARVLVDHGCVVGDTIEILTDFVGRVDEAPGLSDYLQSLAKRLSVAEQNRFVHPAMSSDNIHLLKLLFRAGFSTTGLDKDGLPLFFCALMREKRGVLKVLADHGANTNEWVPQSVLDESSPNLPWHGNLSGARGATPLDVSARVMNSASMTKLLLELGANPNTLRGSANQEPVLIGCCSVAYISVARVLIDGGADVNLAGRDGRAAVYWAACCGNTELLKLLVARGANVNIQYRHDMSTPLLIARQRGDAGMVKVLLDAGAKG